MKGDVPVVVSMTTRGPSWVSPAGGDRHLCIDLLPLPEEVASWSRPGHWKSAEVLGEGRLRLVAYGLICIFEGNKFSFKLQY